MVLQDGSALACGTDEVGLGALEAVGHRIESIAELGHFIAAGEARAGGEVSLAETPGGPGDAIKTSRDAAGEPGPDD
jgi:hypothetical protein